MRNDCRALENRSPAARQGVEEARARAADGRNQAIDLRLRQQSCQTPWNELEAAQVASPILRERAVVDGFRRDAKDRPIPAGQLEIHLLPGLERIFADDRKTRAAEIMDEDGDVAVEKAALDAKPHVNAGRTALFASVPPRGHQVKTSNRNTSARDGESGGCPRGCHGFGSAALTLFVIEGQIPYPARQVLH
jgi:hypothetical protein